MRENANTLYNKKYVALLLLTICVKKDITYCTYKYIHFQSKCQTIYKTI